MNKELENGLKTALTNEIAGEDFYVETAENAKDEFTENTFRHLAIDELTHIRRIKSFIRTNKADEIEENIRNRNPKSGLRFFGMTIEKFKKKKKEFKGDLAPYNFAVELEKRSFNLYKKLYSESKDKKSKDLFKFLMKEESTHRKILEDTLSFLKNPEDYFLETEKWNFD